LPLNHGWALLQGHLRDVREGIVHPNVLNQASTVAVSCEALVQLCVFRGPGLPLLLAEVFRYTLANLN
jgi:hypothetical protein